MGSTSKLVDDFDIKPLIGLTFALGKLGVLSGIFYRKDYDWIVEGKGETMELTQELCSYWRENWNRIEIETEGNI